MKYKILLTKSNKFQMIPLSHSRFRFLLDPNIKEKIHKHTNRLSNFYYIDIDLISKMYKFYSKSYTEHGKIEDIDFEFFKLKLI